MMTVAFRNEAERRSVHSYWAARLLGSALLALLLAGLYSKVVLDMVSDWWNDPSLSHGLLIPPVALYFAWLDRKAILSLPARRDPRGMLLVVLAAIIYVVGRLAAEFFLPRISIVVLCAGLIWTLWGPDRARRLIFPLILLAAMVPLPATLYNQMSAPLQQLASQAATAVAQWFGVSVFRDGNILYLANFSLGVEEACSGLTALSSMLIAAFLIGQIWFQSRLPKLALLLISAPLAISVNVVRVAGTAILADWNTDFALGYYHVFSGWFVFTLGLTGLCGCAALIAVHVGVVAVTLVLRHRLTPPASIVLVLLGSRMNGAMNPAVLLLPASVIPEKMLVALPPAVLRKICRYTYSP